MCVYGTGGDYSFIISSITIIIIIWKIKIMALLIREKKAHKQSTYMAATYKISQSYTLFRCTILSTFTEW